MHEMKVEVVGGGLVFHLLWFCLPLWNAVTAGVSEVVCWSWCFGNEDQPYKCCILKFIIQLMLYLWFWLGLHSLQQGGIFSQTISILVSKIPLNATVQ